jgi:hypothetical protein
MPTEPANRETGQELPLDRFLPPDDDPDDPDPTLVQPLVPSRRPTRRPEQPAAPPDSAAG